MTNCPRCATPLPPDAPGGLCPACLLLGARSAARQELEAVEKVRRGFQEHVSELELGDCIGSGGTGVVFRARHASLGREVAVKVLDPGLGREPEFAERFAREAETMARLEHANIVAVRGHGRAGQLFYLVLEYVSGPSLRQVLDSGPLAPQRALVIVAQIAAALEFAHGRGVVHRDVKPENILIEDLDRVKVADFGIAKFSDDEAARASLTSTGRALGTLRYMAPEQLERPHAVDQRADLYSLGVVFYEMLTGEIPMGRFALPSTRAGVDERLDEVVLHMLDRDPEHRYTHASEVKRDVEAIAAGPKPRETNKDGRAVPRLRPIARRFSWLAVSSMMVALGWAMNCMIVIWFVLPAPRSFEDESVQFTFGEPFTVFGPSIILGGFSLASIALSCILARAALDRIRGQWPHLYGVGAAMVGLWFLPLFLVNVLCGGALARATLDRGEFVSPGSAALFGVACLSVDAWWIARRRNRVMRELTGDLGQRRE